SLICGHVVAVVHLEAVEVIHAVHADPPWVVLVGIQLLFAQRDTSQTVHDELGVRVVIRVQRPSEVECRITRQSSRLRSGSASQNSFCFATAAAINKNVFLKIVHRTRKILRQEDANGRYVLRQFECYLDERTGHVRSQGLLRERRRTLGERLVVDTRLCFRSSRGLRGLRSELDVVRGRDDQSEFAHGGFERSQSGDCTVRADGGNQVSTVCRSTFSQRGVGSVGELLVADERIECIAVLGGQNLLALQGFLVVLGNERLGDGSVQSSLALFARLIQLDRLFVLSDLSRHLVHLLFFRGSGNSLRFRARVQNLLNSSEQLVVAFRQLVLHD